MPASPPAGGTRSSSANSKPAERIINADPDAWYTATPEHMGSEAYADYQHAIHDPETVHAMLEDYRAGLGIDRGHDDDDRHAERRIRCPLLVLWATRDDLPNLYGNVLDIWKPWADLRGAPITSGHHMAEEATRRAGRRATRLPRPIALSDGG